jgi:hypothetical protein
MRRPYGPRQVLSGLAVVVCLVGVGAVTLARSAVGGPVASVEAAALDEPLVDLPGPSSTTTSPPPTSPPTTSTTVTPTTAPPTTAPTTKATTPTTQRRPVPTTAARATTTAPPATTPFVSPVVQPLGRSPEERCTAALRWLAGQGLALPAGWGFRCPGVALERGVAKWGVACWNCDLDGNNWIAVDVGRIGASDATLRYVVAHETCHANDYAGLGITTELGADLCAALHGAPRP